MRMLLYAFALALLATTTVYARGEVRLYNTNYSANVLERLGAPDVIRRAQARPAGLSAHQGTFQVAYPAHPDTRSMVHGNYSANITIEGIRSGR